MRAYQLLRAYVRVVSSHLSPFLPMQVTVRGAWCEPQAQALPLALHDQSRTSGYGAAVMGGGPGGAPRQVTGTGSSILVGGAPGRLVTAVPA